MKTHTAAIIILALLCSCDEKRSTVSHDDKTMSGSSTGRMFVTADNVSISSDEALKIARITMVHPPEVIFYSYQAGFDDNMKLVLRIPEGKVEEFWNGSPWNSVDSREASGDGSTPTSPRISDSGDPKWLEWKKSSVGTSNEASLPNGEAARVYLAADLEEGFLHAFIFWHQT